MAFAGCVLPVLGVCVLLLSVKSEKSEQLEEAGDCFPLRRAAGQLLVLRHCCTTPGGLATPSQSLGEVGGPAMQQEHSGT